MTELSKYREELAEVLAEHEPDVTSYDAADIHGCMCGFALTNEQQRAEDYGWGAYRIHLADALLPVLARVVAEAKAEALREAAGSVSRYRLAWLSAARRARGARFRGDVLASAVLRRLADDLRAEASGREGEL